MRPPRPTRSAAIFAKLARRIVAVSIVGGVAFTAVAAVGVPGVVVTPQVQIVRVAVNGSGVGSAELRNGSTSSITVHSIARTSCDQAEVFLQTPALPFTVPGNTTAQLDYGCAMQSSAGMKRCTYQARDAAGEPIVDFEAVCMLAGQSSITTTPATPMVDFGDVEVGTTGTATIQIQSSSPYAASSAISFQTTDLEGNFQIAAPCNQNARECDASVAGFGSNMPHAVTVLCTPQAGGTRTAELQIATSTGYYLTAPIQLRCNGTAPSSPAIAVSPSPVDNGPIEVLGAASTTRQLRIENIGTGTLAIGSLVINDVVPGASGDWSYAVTGQCSGTVPPACNLTAGQYLDVALKLDPSAIGARDASLLINYKDTIVRSKAIQLRGVGIGATLSVVGDLDLINFGQVPLNMSAPVTLELVNDGNRSTTAMLEIDPPGPFGLAPATSVVVPATPALPTEVTATCTPTSAGVFMTTFHAASADAFNSDPIAILGKCEGTTALIHGVPTTVLLGEVRTGTPAVERTIEVRGAGVGLSSVALEREPPDPNLAVTPLTSMITPSHFDLVVTPTADSDLSETAIIVTPTSGPPLRIPISGKVVTASYDVADQVSLGSFCVNQETTPSTVRLTSTGTATLGVEEPTKIQPDSPFELRFASPVRYPAKLAPGAVASVGVTPNRRLTPGTTSGDLSWKTDVAGAELATTNVSAVFLTEGAAAAPSTLGFGKVPIHVDTMNAQSVTLQNCEDTAIQLDAPEVPAPYAIDSPSFPTVLMPNQAATFSVGFHPLKAERFVRTLRIKFKQPALAPLEITLDGEGFTGDGSGSGDELDPTKTSFYACAGCASNDASGVLAILLAAACAVLPRRRRRAISARRPSGSS